MVFETTFAGGVSVSWKWAELQGFSGVKNSVQTLSGQKQPTFKVG